MSGKTNLQGEGMDARMNAGVLFAFVTLMVLQSHNSNKERAPFNGDVKIAQHKAGRLRLYAAVLKNPERAESVRVNLGRVRALASVAVNTLTGSLLVTYDAAEIKPDILELAIYRLLEIESSDASKRTIVRGEVGVIHEALDLAVMEKTKKWFDLDTVVACAFIGLAVKGILQTNSIGAPAPLTLLYWAYKELVFGRSSS